MRLVYAHFPINVTLSKNGDMFTIKNFIGEKQQHDVKMQPGVKVTLGTDNKDEYIFEGCDNAAVSLSCAQISQCCKIGRKDERKFLDGIFVSQKTVIQPKDD